MVRQLPPLKRFGQNFLTDNNIIAKIINDVATNREDIVLEIGPGRGALTFELAKCAAFVLAVEIDRGLSENLKDSFSAYRNVEIVPGDILKVDLKKELKKRKILSVKVVANLPYYITTPILEYLFNNAPLIKDIFIMVQKEVADRMTAKPGTKAYGSLSCFVNYFTIPEILFKIKGASFYPAPRVDSCFVRLKPLKDPENYHGAKSQVLLFDIIRTAFGQRRKRLYGSLSKIVAKEQLNSLPCRKLLELRPEELSLRDFVYLSNVVFDFSGVR